MALKKIGTLAGLPPGSLTHFVDGERHYAICNSGGELHALAGSCPHQGAPLGYGALHGSEIVCPWHAWAFDCRTGAHDYDPDIRLRKFPVIVEGEDIFADLP
jgi:nitrite reductase/ring-hydroxylating ferredoxin subunit